MNYKIYFLLLGGFFSLKAEDPSTYTTEQKEAIADTVAKINNLTNEYKELGKDGNEKKKEEIIKMAIPLLTAHDHEGKKVEGLEVLPYPDSSYTQAVNAFKDKVGSSVLDPVHKKLESLKSTIEPSDPGARNLKIIAEDMKTQSFANSAYYHMMMHGGKRSFSEGDDAQSGLKKRLHDDGLDDFDDSPKKELTREEQIEQLKKGRSKEEILASGGVQDDMGRKYNKKFEENEEKKPLKSTGEHESSDLKPLFDDIEHSDEIEKESIEGRTRALDNKKDGDDKDSILEKDKVTFSPSVKTKNSN